MRNLKSFKMFFEEVDLNVQPTDEPDVKSAKDQLLKLRKDISEYNAKKSLIDNSYLKIELEADLQKKIDEILGKDNKNQFLSEYLHISKLKRKIDKLQKDITNDKVKKDDFNEELKLSKDGSTKQAVSVKIADITNRISTNTASIASVTKEISDAQLSLNKKMTDVEKNMMDNIKKLTSQS